MTDPSTVDIQSILKNYSERLRETTHQLILQQARTEMLERELAEARAMPDPQSEDGEVTP